VLWGENLIEARELLREIVGAIRLHLDTDHLIAKFERSEIPLLAVENGGLVAGARFRIGSQ
jgi:hypothetical protein